MTSDALTKENLLALHLLDTAWGHSLALFVPVLQVTGWGTPGVLPQWQCWWVTRWCGAGTLQPSRESATGSSVFPARLAPPTKGVRSKVATPRLKQVKHQLTSYSDSPLTIAYILLFHWRIFSLTPLLIIHWESKNHRCQTLARTWPTVSLSLTAPP